MIVRSLIVVVVALLAALGNARIALFAVNRVAFAHKEEDDRMHWALRIVPIVLLLLAPLYWFLWRGIDDATLGIAATAGAVWTAVTVLAGVYWVVDVGFRRHLASEVEGVVSGEPRVIRLRKAHIPFQWLRNLGAHNDVYDLELTFHEIEIPDLPEPFDGYTIAFMTDTHVAGFMRRGFYRECIAQINQRDVDLMLFGGDFVTWRRHIPLMAQLLITDLRAKDGIYAVIGNHDYWADVDGIVAALTARGVRFLVNRSVEIRRGDTAIDLVGIDEVYRGYPDVGEAFRNTSASRPCIAASHHPDIIDLLTEPRVDLLVCGHTHGGQIRLPWFGPIVVPSRHEALFASGFYRSSNVLMYVSRGIGAVPPLRILCRPELPFFTLRRAAARNGREEQGPVPARSSTR